MRQPLAVDCDMPLDTRYFLTRIIALFFGGAGVFDTLGIND